MHLSPGDVKRPFPGVSADMRTSNQHIVVPGMAGEGFRLVSDGSGCSAGGKWLQEAQFAAPL